MIERQQIPCRIKEFASGGELLKKGQDIDILFLDIRMDDLDGMKTAGLIRKKMLQESDPSGEGCL